MIEVVLVGQLPSYITKPRLPELLLVVSIAFVNLRISEAEFAVKEYHRSSLLSVTPQFGSGDECVAPVVFASIELEQVEAKD